MTLRSLIAREVREAVARLLSQGGLEWPGDLELLVEQPARIEHGDYTTNVALQLARHLRKPPIQIAAQLAGELRALPIASRVEAAAPGFVNIWLDWRWWASHGAMLPEPSKARAAEKVVVEHTSVNPNKAAHVGHLRNACIGDTLARLLRRVGYRVEVHNYIDDLGNQVADTVVGILHVPVTGRYNRFGDFCWDVYARVSQAYERDEALKARRAEVLHALEAGDNNTAWLGRLVAERVVQEHVAEMAEFGITYDLLVWESDIVREGFWAAAFDQLQHSPLFVKETRGRLAGCWVLKQPQPEQEGPAEAAAGQGDEAGDDEHLADKVLVRSNGVLTYTAKDIAYHLWKFGLLGKEFRYRRFAPGLWTTAPEGTSRPFGRATRVLNVIDRRQEYPQAMVRLALQALGFGEPARALHHVSYGVVSLSPATAARLGMDTSEGRPSYPMSGRQGIGIKIRDLLDLMEASIDRERSRQAGLSSRAIAAGAIRYFLLRYNLGTEIVFDMDSALDVHGNTGPYLMYAHARAAGILRKGGLESRRLPAAPERVPEVSEVERALLRHLADWPDTLETAAGQLNPTLVTTYAYKLAQCFTDFYENMPVLKAPEDERPFRLWLVALSRAVLADALDVLGLPAPERM